ncbi:MAG: amino acid ABC transporter substrate-binding protein [Chloroflexota bacterium]
MQQQGDITMKNTLVPVMLIIGCLLAVHPGHAQGFGEIGPITAQIIERGELVCGVNSALPGFSSLDEANLTYVGFDVDICRAVAAAILSDAEAVSFREVAATERAEVLASGEVDLLSRNTTWTLERDTGWDVTFAPIVFYDGQGLMVRADADYASVNDMNGATICINAGTTTEQNIRDVTQMLGLSVTLQTYDSLEAAYEAFFDEMCDVITADRSGLIAQRATNQTPGQFVILDDVLSREPLSPATAQRDPQFADVVRWTIYGMINAEELGISSENVDTFTDSDSPAVQRLLGIGGTPAGDYLGIPNDFMVTVLQQVGNYGEVYERNLGAETPYDLPRGLNNLFNSGGLIYAPPFR